MKPAATCLVLLAASMMPSCNSVEEEEAKTRSLEKRIESEDERIAARTERRRMRAETEDQRYEDWYNRIMDTPSD